MQNIIKSLYYQTKRDNVTYYAFIAVILSYFMVFSEFKSVFSVTGSEYFVQAQALFCLPVSIFPVILSTRICGWDYVDKTMNYEILIGHSRKEVFFSRVWVSFVWCMSVSVIAFVLPPLVLSFINGWGIYMDMGDMIFRCVLSVFTIFRMYCECVLLTFLTKSCYIGLIVSFLFVEIGSIIPMALEEIGRIKIGNFVTAFSMANFQTLVTPEKYSYQFINGKDEMLFDMSVDPSFAAATIIVSLAVGIGCILIGYLYFRKSDMK
ncbi:MAG: hypothetical protein E7485_01400 [Ruminococcaceae bacterium]|nr:hypothetical protein [Oscillospiraceae bacterium]